jgi:hypothetical protein
VAKTSLAEAPLEVFLGLDELMATLPPDAAMRLHAPPVSRDPGCDRVPEERRNVIVETWIYAAKREDDHDYHLILGSTPSLTAATHFLTAEISGLPASGPYQEPLARARAEFAELFAGDLPGTSSYTKYDPPLHVNVAGSLFFDVDHPAGVVGPVGFRPATAWEVHPVSDLVPLEP